MSREIKFRAWDGNKMHQKLDMSGFTELNEVFTRGAEWGAAFMQYTGLKDKHGVEIYEGDVIRNKYGKVAVVEFRLGAFVAKWDDTILNKVLYFWNDDGFEGEVIGNIYENPKALECQHVNDADTLDGGRCLDCGIEYHLDGEAT